MLKTFWKLGFIGTLSIIMTFCSFTAYAELDPDKQYTWDDIKRLRKAGNPDGKMIMPPVAFNYGRNLGIAAAFKEQMWICAELDEYGKCLSVQMIDMTEEELIKAFELVEKAGYAALQKSKIAEIKKSLEYMYPHSEFCGKPKIELIKGYHAGKLRDTKSSINYLSRELGEEEVK